MSKAVLISIRPKWCELIASGEKTIEVRKTRPKIETPFKCYIYCTNGVPYLNRHNGKLYLEPKDSIGGQGYGLYERLSGKVIGEFVCDCIKHYITLSSPNFNSFYMKVEKPGVATEINFGETCLTEEDFFEYASGKDLFGWHISNLVIYDEPKKLSEFKSYNTLIDFECGYPMPTHGIRRPPQSWMYVEELA